jgi:hypothetical protein
MPRWLLASHNEKKAYCNHQGESNSYSLTAASSMEERSSRVVGGSSGYFQAVGVALPPTVREANRGLVHRSNQHPIRSPRRHAQAALPALRGAERLRRVDPLGDFNHRCVEERAGVLTHFVFAATCRTVASLCADCTKGQYPLGQFRRTPKVCCFGQAGWLINFTG